MSKCDLQIVFDWADRTYRGGEEVAGEVRVRVNRDVTCDGLMIEHFWQTHGRGNRATGAKQGGVVFKGQWRAGESFRYPFRFNAPAGPPTYRGTYLNVDHYVNVRVDIPWALDPKHKEEYIVLPGSQAYRHGSIGVARQQAKVGFEKVGVPLGIGLIAVGSIFCFPVGLALIPAGLIVLFFALRRTLAERKIGKVHLLFSSLSVAPGGQVPVRVSFTPRNSSSLNGISARLVGKEVCVSGSGTKRTTHTHKFHDRMVMLASRGKVSAGDLVRLDGRIAIPQINAYSFSAKDNKIVWAVEIRIDIPMWPDWIRSQTITVRPAESAEVVEAQIVTPSAGEVPAREAPILAQRSPDVTQAPPEPAASPETFPGVTPVLPADDLAAAETPSPQPVQGEADLPQEPPEAEEVPSDRALIAIVERLGAANRYSREREQIVAEQADRTFVCPIEVTRVERTYGIVPEDRYRGGRTITGKVAGTDCKVSAWLSAARNEEADALESGEVFRAECVLSKWNSIYEQLDVREA